MNYELCYLPQQCLYFLPEPQGHGSFLPTLGAVRTTWTFSGLLLDPIGELLWWKEAMELWCAEPCGMRRPWVREAGSSVLIRTNTSKDAMEKRISSSIA